MNKFIPYIIVGVVMIAGIGYILRPGGQKVINPPTEQITANTISTKANKPMEGQDSFGLAVCDEVPKSLVEKTIGKTVEETEDKSSNTSTGCTYYTNKAKLEHILIQVSYLSAENQKKGQQALGRTIVTNGAIPIEHFIAMQENDLINAIYLVMTPNKFVRVDRTENAASNDQLIALAKQVALIIIGK
jgi:hypothetical protein